MASSFPALVADALGAERFSLLDIGCSGGIDPKWRAFGARLRAIGIDASETECRRLASLEQASQKGAGEDSLRGGHCLRASR